MNIYIAVMFFQNIPIWRDSYYADAPPELTDLNEQLGLFGDKLYVKQITDNCLLRRLREGQIV